MKAGVSSLNRFLKMISHIIRLVSINLIFILFLSVQGALAGNDKKTVPAPAPASKPVSKGGSCAFQAFAAAEGTGATTSTSSDDFMQSWAGKWERVAHQENKDGGLSYKYFVGLNQPNRFFIDPKVGSSLKEFSLAEQQEFVDQPMHVSEISKWFPEFGEAFCPKTLNEWDIFRMEYADGTLIQKRIGKLREEARAQLRMYPLVAEMLVDYCSEVSPFKTNPQWQSCTNKMTRLVQMLASAPSPNRMPGIKNLSHASSEEQAAFRALFELPAAGAQFLSKDEKQNPWLILASSLRRVSLDENRLTEEDVAKYRELMETSVKQFREGVLKLDPDALVVYTEAAQIEINSFPLGGRVMVFSATPWCVTLLQMPVIGRSQSSSVAELKKAITGNLYRSYFVASISQCSHDPINGKKLDRPIVFGEAFKAINEARIDQDIQNTHVSFNSWKAANSSHLCASCHADAFKEPLANSKGLPFVDSDSLAKMKLRAKERLGDSKKQPVWVAKWPLEGDSAEGLLFNRDVTDGPDLALKNSAQDNAILEAALDSCLPEDRRKITEYREYIKNNMKCGKCHYEGGRAQGMRGPLKIRLPGSWGFDRGSTTVDVSALHKELLFSVTINNSKKPGLLMPPSRRVSTERFTTEGPDLERCLLQAYYGPFLRLEPFAGRLFSADGINYLSNNYLSNKSVMVEWLRGGISCVAQE